MHGLNQLISFGVLQSPLSELLSDADCGRRFTDSKMTIVVAADVI